VKKADGLGAPHLDRRPCRSKCEGLSVRIISVLFSVKTQGTFAGTPTKTFKKVAPATHFLHPAELRDFRGLSSVGRAPQWH
jgi:hypothetical protein